MTPLLIRLIHSILPALLILQIIPLGGAEAAETAAWNVSCPISHYKTDDPVMFPGQTGASHMHAFFANTTTNSATTTASLLAAPSTCVRGFDNADHSAYWVPALYRKSASGGADQVSGMTGQEQSMTVYYRRAGQSNGPQVEPFPQGLRMIAGNAAATAPQPSSVVHWRCRDLKNGSNIGPPSAEIPSCPVGHFVEGVIIFPNCWNGSSLDSIDHTSHMVYPAGKNSVCPSSHPVVLPRVTMEVKFRTANGDGSAFSLSSGSQYSLHGDFFAAWDNKTQSALVNSCLNSPRKCTGINLKDVDIGAATLIKGSNGRVLADTTNVEPLAALPASEQSASTQTRTQSSVSPTTLPETGSAFLMVAVAVIAMLLGYFYYRRSRQDLLASLRRSK